MKLTEGLKNHIGSMAHLALGNPDPSSFHRKWKGFWIEGVRNLVGKYLPSSGEATGISPLPRQGLWSEFCQDLPGLLCGHLYE